MATEKKVSPKEEKIDACFYFPDYSSITRLLKVQDPDNPRKLIRLPLHGENHIVKISAEDQFFNEKVDYMRKSSDNRANGGHMFIEMKSGESKDPKEHLLDELLELPTEGLISMLKKPRITDKRLSRGNLMVKVLKQRKAI